MSRYESDAEKFKRIITSYRKALMFKFYDKEFTVREGYVDEDTRLYCYVTSDDGSRIDMYKSRQIDKKEGTIKNHFVWYFWDGTEEDKKRLTGLAVKVFRSHHNSKILTLEYELKQLKKERLVLNKLDTEED